MVLDRNIRSINVTNVTNDNMKNELNNYQFMFDVPTNLKFKMKWTTYYKIKLSH